MFDAKIVCQEIIDYIRDYFKQNNLKGAVVGVSGGKDSGVVVGLLTAALGSENVVGISMPCHSKDIDAKLAKSVAEHFGIELFSTNLTAVCDEFEEVAKESFSPKSEKSLVNSSTNLKPRLRMSMLYYCAAMLSSERGGNFIVIGTGNKCEMFVGYFTKGGDGVGDLFPLGDLTVSEVIAVGEVLGVPKEVLHRTPSDGLSELSDEEKLGVTYADIEKYIENPESVSSQVAGKIKKLHDSSRHKFNFNFYKK